MKAAEFDYARPATVEEVCRLLDSAAGDGKIIAGGQTLVPLMVMRLTRPSLVIDINRIAALQGIAANEDGIVVKAATRQADALADAAIRRHLPLLLKGLRHVGHVQTRNRGTIGGSLCHLDPSAEMPTVMMALDAKLLLQSAQGSRVVAMSAFGEGVMTTVLLPDEMLTQIRVRPWADAHGAHFVEFARRHGDFAVVSAAAMVELDGNERIARAAFALGGVAAMPFRVAAAERASIGHADDAAFDRAAQAARDSDALDDPAFPSWYRQRLAVALLAKAIKGAHARALAKVKR